MAFRTAFLTPLFLILDADPYSFFSIEIASQAFFGIYMVIRLVPPLSDRALAKKSTYCLVVIYVYYYNIFLYIIMYCNQFFLTTYRLI